MAHLEALLADARVSHRDILLALGLLRCLLERRHRRTVLAVELVGARLERVELLGEVADLDRLLLAQVAQQLRRSLAFVERLVRELLVLGHLGAELLRRRLQLLEREAVRRRLLAQPVHRRDELVVVPLHLVLPRGVRAHPLLELGAPPQQRLLRAHTCARAPPSATTWDALARRRQLLLELLRD